MYAHTPFYKGIPIAVEILETNTELKSGQYPSLPPLSNSSTESFASFASTSTKATPVQAFIGTPQDLSAQLGKGVIFSRWSLASAHLLDDVLSDDLIVSITSWSHEMG